MVHALTIDVEDYYSVFARDRLDHDGPPTDAVVRNTDRVLRLLRDHDCRATFFVLGEVAETFPDLVRAIAAEGHEVGVHGYAHRQVFRMEPETFRADVRRAREAVEQAAGEPARGYRAPAFSIGRATAWALEVLADLGFRYDSSVFPISGRRYGWPDAAPVIHPVPVGEGRSLVEVPLTTVRVLGRRLPCCGGGYLRHFPYAVTRWAMRRVARRRPAVVYFHPYDLDTAPPPADFAERLAAAGADVQRFHRRQIRRRETVEGKLRRLLEAFAFAPAARVIDDVLGPAAGGGT